MNLLFWQIMFLALLQGVTELFPISSLGHTVIFPGLLPWFFSINSKDCMNIQPCTLVNDVNFLPIIVALHLGTAIALVIYFWRDWLQVLQTLVKSVKEAEVHKGTDEWVSWLIIIGCIPAGLIGVFLEKPLKQLFTSPLIAAAFLVVNGSILFAGERLRRRAEAKMVFLTPKEREAHFRPLSSLSWKEAIIVGVAQSLALIPGISRSGSTMVAGLGVRLSHEDAARYSFLLGTPLIAGAGLIEVPQLFSAQEPVSKLTFMAFIGLGMVLAGVAAFLSTKYLMKYFETGRLDPFAYYCWAAGLLAFFLFVAVLHVS